MSKSVFRCTLLSMVAIGLVLSGMGSPGLAVAADTVPAETTVTIPAGGEAVIEGNAFCLNLGEPFPVAVEASGARADDQVVKVLKAAALDGTGSSDVLQTQIAIWNAVEGAWPYKDKDVDMTVAKSLAERAAEQTTEPLMGGGVALDEAIRNGDVEITATEWEQLDAPKALPGDAPYYGAVRLTVKNLGSEALDVYTPLGLVLEAANEAEQDMGLYAVSQREIAPVTLPKTGGQDPLPLAAALAGLLLAPLGWAVRRRRHEPV